MYLNYKVNFSKTMLVLEALFVNLFVFVLNANALNKTVPTESKKEMLVYKNAGCECCSKWENI